MFHGTVGETKAREPKFCTYSKSAGVPGLSLEHHSALPWNRPE